MKLVFNKRAIEDIKYFKKTNPKLHTKLKFLINEICDSPFEGNGKPERLKYSYSKCWSRRLNREHRIVYTVNEELITILQCRYHY